jgi:uncharacterized protein YecT (DUF1311 family)
MLELLHAAALASAPNNDVCKSELDDDLTMCAQQHFAAADAELNRIWKQVRNYPGLIKSQRLWLAYRDADCEARNPSTPEGRLYLALKDDCLTELTKRRIEDLREVSRR